MEETEGQMEVPLHQEHPMDPPDREARPENSRKRRERCLQAAVAAAEAALERPGVLLGPEEV